MLLEARNQLCTAFLHLHPQAQPVFNRLCHMAYTSTCYGGVEKNKSASTALDATIRLGDMHICESYVLVCLDGDTGDLRSPATLPHCHMLASHLSPIRTLTAW